MKSYQKVTWRTPVQRCSTRVQYLDSNPTVSRFLGLGLGLGLETCGLGLELGLVTYGLGLGLGLDASGLKTWT